MLEAVKEGFTEKVTFELIPEKWLEVPKGEKKAEIWIASSSKEFCFERKARKGELQILRREGLERLESDCELTLFKGLDFIL